MLENASGVLAWLVGPCFEFISDFDIRISDFRPENWRQAATQILFYTMGETQMGQFGFASWTLHMASIIIFSTMWGWIFREWEGSGRKAHALIAHGIAARILSTIVVGCGIYLKAGH